MKALTNQDMGKGKKQLEGILVLCWVMSILLGLALLTGIFRLPMGLGRMPFALNSILTWLQTIIWLPSRLLFSWWGAGIYMVELAAIYSRKAFAVPLGRAVLVVTMVFLFPVGTIVGAILWKRLNNPSAQGYLNYSQA
ncbi:MAG: hypothetical protein PHN32_07185 [Actinomycetota bacterium]|nr:hypothetical protein [Actinomycetota bacterium]